MKSGSRRRLSILALVATAVGCANSAALDELADDDPGDELGAIAAGERNALEPWSEDAPVSSTEEAPAEAPLSAPPSAPAGVEPASEFQDPNPSEGEALTQCTSDTQQWWRSNKDRDITFVAFGDTQTSSLATGCRVHSQFRKKQAKLMRDAINSVDAHEWPGGAGFHNEGELYDHVRGVLIAGDLTQSGSDSVPAGKLSHDCPEYTVYRNSYGRCGNEGLLKLPVYEGYGNHDFPWMKGGGDPEYHPVIEYLDGITAAHRPGQPSDLYDDPASGTGHYAWRWDDVWFVNLDLKPGWLDEVIEKKHTRIAAPHDSLGFLQSFLESLDTSETRQIVVMTHYPLSSSRIRSEERKAFCRLLSRAQSGKKPFADQKLSSAFPVIHIHGHTHHAPSYRKFTCPGAYSGIQIPSFNVGTPLYPNPHNGPGKLHFTVFRLGNKYLEVAGVSAKKANPKGKWSYVLRKRLKILHEP